MGSLVIDVVQAKHQRYATMKGRRTNDGCNPAECFRQIGNNEVQISVFLSPIPICVMKNTD